MPSLAVMMIAFALISVLIFKRICTSTKERKTCGLDSKKVPGRKHHWRAHGQLRRSILSWAHSDIICTLRCTRELAG